MRDWVAIIEFDAVSGDLGFAVDMVEALVDQLREWHPIGMYHPDRYALQLHVPADGAGEALHTAVANHELAARAVGITSSFLRAEIVTLGEFEEAWLAGMPESGQAASGAGQALASTEAYQATRALIGATTTQDVTDVVVRFVHTVGATVHVGSPRELPGMVTIDLSIAAEQPLYASAQAVSMACLSIERWLPALVDDAKSALILLDQR